MLPGRDHMCSHVDVGFSQLKRDLEGQGLVRDGLGGVKVKCYLCLI